MGRHSARTGAGPFDLRAADLDAVDLDAADLGIVRPRPAGGRRRISAVVVAMVVLGTGGALFAANGLGEAGNAVLNSSLDDGLAGWGVNPGAKLESVPGRHGRGGRISQTQRDHWTIALNDAINSVPATTAGATYRAEAWVRSQPGQQVSLRLMAYRGSILRGQALDSQTVPDDGWHRLSVTYRAVESGDSIDLNVVAHDLPSGRGVDVDDVRLFLPEDAHSSGATTPSGGPAPEGAAPVTAQGAVTGAPRASGPAGPATRTAGQTTTRTSQRGSSAHTRTSSGQAPSSGSGRPEVTSPPSGRSGWKLVWADEFAGSGVDSARWRAEDYSTYGDGNNELACLMNRPENVNVSGGVLHLVARRESTPIACGSSDSRFPGGRQFTSANLTTKGKADWTYGRFEVRAKLPTAPGTTKGLWPAFWLRPSAGGTGELDVLEAIGTDGSGSEHTKVHQTVWYDYSGTHRQQPTTVTVPGALPSAAYHVYAVEWERGEMRWYIDDVLTYTRTPSTTPWLDEAFAKPFYLRLNLAVGGNWPGSPTSATDFPASYDVDYVRVYQR